MIFRSSIDISEYNSKALLEFLKLEFERECVNIPDCLLAIKSKKISWTVNGSYKYIKFSKDRILTNSSKRVHKLLQAINSVTNKIPYTENTISDDSVRMIELPTTHFRSFKSPLDRYEYLCNSLEYISSWSPTVMSHYITNSGAWLLQGWPGTGKTEFIKLLAASKNEPVTRIFIFTKGNVLDRLIELGKYRYDHPNGVIIAVFEEVDRLISTPENVSSTTVASTESYVLEKLGNNTGEARMMVKEIVTNATQDFEVSPSKVRVYGSGKIDVENPTSGKSVAALIASYKVLLSHYSKEDSTTRINLDLLLKFIEEVHQLSLSMIKNTTIIFTTNKPFKSTTMTPEQLLALNTTFRPNRCNVLQYTYLTLDLLITTLSKRFCNMSPIKVRLLSEQLMKYEFNKQYNLKELLGFFDPNTITDSNYLTVLDAAKEFNRISSLDGFLDTPKSPTMESPKAVNNNIMSAVLDGVIN